MASEAMPTPIAKPLNCSSTSKSDQRLQRPGTPAPPARLTWPDGIGRERVRSTCASRSRSTMSFQVQPAPRMAKAPTKNSTTCQRLADSRASAMAASADRPPARQQQQPGADRPVEAGQPQIGPQPAGARLSTQLPVASATRPAAWLIATGRCRSGCRRCRGPSAWRRYRRR